MNQKWFMVTDIWIRTDGHTDSVKRVSLNLRRGMNNKKSTALPFTERLAIVLKTLMLLRNTGRTNMTSFTNEFRFCKDTPSWVPSNISQIYLLQRFLFRSESLVLMANSMENNSRKMSVSWDVRYLKLSVCIQTPARNVSEDYNRYGK